MSSSVIRANRVRAITAMVLGPRALMDRASRRARIGEMLHGPRECEEEEGRSTSTEW